MKIPLVILAFVALCLGAFMLFAPRPGPDQLVPRTDLPWQISVLPDGGSRVFDLDLGRATLADAMAKFGGLEGLAVFEPEGGEPTLEAFFGTVQLGPLNAKVIVSLAATADEFAALIERAGHREGSRSGDWKYRLDEPPAVHQDRLVRAISYVPGTRGLDADFFLERLGEPTATRRESDTAVSWFYPELGLTVLIDDEAREVLEYQPPRDFVLPDDTTTWTATRAAAPAD